MQLALFDKSKVIGGAEFSPCRTWRYALLRQWDFSDHPEYVAFIGLNPSTADEKEDDPTIRRCIQFAISFGFGGLFMLNLFAFRATQPADMKAAPDPIGPKNDDRLLRVVGGCKMTIAAWGVHGKHLGRDAAVEELLRANRLLDRIHCLGVTKDGHPKHPLYLPKTAKPEKWRAGQ